MPETKKEPLLAPCILAAVIPTAFALLFVTKAYHIDDPLFVWMAQHILENPLDFFGIDVNWDATTRPMYEANQNPPGVSYYLAAIGLLFGWGEIPAHVGMALVAGLAGTGTFLLARELCGRPLFAAALTAASPSFFVSATSVMSDIPMLAMYVWALVIWIYGDKRDDHRLLFAASILVVCSGLTKYFGFSALPLMLAYTLARRGKPGLWLLHGIAPIALFAVYLWWSERQYGINLLIFAAEFASDPSWTEDETRLSRQLSGLVFAGACCAPVLFAAPFLWSRKVVGATLLGAVALSLPFPATASMLEWLLGSVTELRWRYALQITLWALTGGLIVALIVSSFREKRDAETLLCALWIAGTFVFSVFVNHMVNARTMLPMAPAVAILVARRMEGRLPAAEWARSVPRPIVALVCSFVLSFWVAIADYQLAASAKAAAQEFAKQRDTMPEKVYFLGHWGYQYYMQEAGAIPFEDKLTEHNEALYAPLERGDMLVLPSISYAWAPDPRQNPLKRQIVISMDAHMSTMNHRAGAGFYSHVWGRLPFVIGQAPPEIFYFYEIGTGAGETAAREVLPGPEEKQ